MDGWMDGWIDGCLAVFGCVLYCKIHVDKDQCLTMLYYIILRTEICDIHIHIIFISNEWNEG